MIDYKKRANSDIRDLIQRNNIPQYEIARRCGVDEGTLCRWLRFELSENDERRQRIMNAIEKGGQDHGEAGNN